jgi:energy-coupling factor transport system permease protein
VFREFVLDLRNFFGFSDKSTVFHNIDPRIKMTYTLLTILVAASINNIITLLILVALNLVLIIIGKIPISKLVSTFRGLLVFSALILIINIALRVVLSWLSLTTVSLTEIFYSVGTAITRLILVALSLIVLIDTTTPREVVQGLASLGISYRYLYSIVLLFRFIPIIFDEILSIYDAQRSRGIELEKVGLIEKIKRLKSIIIPAFVCSLLRAKDLYEALELRGFGYSKKRTFYNQLKITSKDVFFIGFIIVIYGLCFFIQPFIT